MWAYRACLLRVVDADSCWALIDTGFNQRCEVELRLLDVYAPEKREAGGKETTDFARDWFANLSSHRLWPLYIETVQTKVIEPSQKTTFTRYLATVWRYGEETTGVSLNEHVNRFLAGHPEWPRGIGAPK